MDINTLDVADGETKYGYLWNTKDLQTIEDYKQYHYDVGFFLIVLKETDPAWQSQENQKQTTNIFCVEV